MPRAAIELVDPDHVVPARQMGALLVDLARAQPERHGKAKPPPLPHEEQVAELDAGAARETELIEDPSPFVCPDCGGTLFSIREGDNERYRCRVGHAYSLKALAAMKVERLEEALWTAMRTLEEHSEVMRRAALRARTYGLSMAAESFERTAAADDAHLDMLRGVLGDLVS
jgi:two-component system chemotaxis response regulator CheB